LDITPEEVKPFLDKEVKREAAKAIEKLRKILSESGEDID